MKRTLLFVALAAVMVVPLLTTGAVFAIDLADSPPEVRLTGTLYSPDHKDVKGMEHLKFQIRRKELVFKVEDAQDITGDATRLDILESIFPPFLIIEGSDDVIALLQKPETEGKLITMEGYLYVVNAFFRVTKVGEGKK